MKSRFLPCVAIYLVAWAASFGPILNLDYEHNQDFQTNQFRAFVTSGLWPIYWTLRASDHATRFLR